jgi:hypothetical protein
LPVILTKKRETALTVENNLCLGQVATAEKFVSKRQGRQSKLQEKRARAALNQGYRNQLLNF